MTSTYYYWSVTATGAKYCEDGPVQKSTKIIQARNKDMAIEFMNNYITRKLKWKFQADISEDDVFLLMKEG